MPQIAIELNRIPLDTLFRFEHEGTAIVVIRRAAAIHAYLDSCPHAHWPISQGEICGQVLECAGHGWRFDLATGRCLTAPAYRLRTVSAMVSKGQVLLEWEASLTNSNGDSRTE